MADDIARGGHGGTLLVIPDHDAKLFLQRDWVRIKYPCDDDSIWEKARVAIRRFDDTTFSETEQYKLDAAEADVQALLSRLARLAAVDGAVLITDRLRLLGFGCEVNMGTSVSDVWTSDGRTVSVEAFGMRHRSAFRFCNFYPAGLALVCSQDGGIKCVTAANGKVSLSEY